MIVVRGFGVSLVTVAGVIRGVSVRHRMDLRRGFLVGVFVVMRLGGRSVVSVVSVVCVVCAMSVVSVGVTPAIAVAGVVIVGRRGLRMT